MEDKTRHHRERKRQLDCIISMANNFLAIDKKYLNKRLKSIDILIIAQIEEFHRNGHECYITNKQFSEMFGESESTIKRSLDKLEELQIIKRDVAFVVGNGRSNRQRILTLKDSE